MSLKRTVQLTLGITAIIGIVALTRIYAGTNAMNQQLPSMKYAGEWLNSKPLTSADLAGKVVLIDIWEFTCVNCLRTMPYIKEWNKKYADDGLVVIGVHCPEFEFGRDSSNVARFARANGIVWPIVLDNEYKIWKQLNNQYWPRKFLFDHNGKLVYDHIGEGGYHNTEEKIRELLAQRNGKPYSGDMTAYARTQDQPGSFCYPSSPETYAGYLRGSLGNTKSVQDQIMKYPSEDQSPNKNTPYLKGEWVQTREYLQYAGNGDVEDRLTYRFTGSEMNAVLRGPANSETVPISVEITFDDRPVPQEWRGSDIIEQSGKTVLLLKEPRMYRVILAHKEHGEHTIKIYPHAPGFELYAFTFGSCAILD